MKFLKYLNEDIDFSELNRIELYTEDVLKEINQRIQKECKYYLNLTQGKYIFSRGMQIRPDLSGIKMVRQDRTPRGMNPDTFKSFNKWLEDNKHVRRDKAVMASHDNNDMTNMFGWMYYIFPIGKFNYTWVKSKDINYNDNKTGWERHAPDKFFGSIASDSSLTKPFETYFTTNKGIKIAYDNKYEIWFDCKKYYYFKKETFGWHIQKKEIITYL